ncbi:hypothetical protein PG987_008803 [Apiospora arundinis]
MGKETEPMPEELSDLLKDPIGLHHLAQEPRDPDQKVAWVKVLIEAGHDVNKLDEKPYIMSNWGRPLHWALEWTGRRRATARGRCGSCSTRQESWTQRKPGSVLRSLGDPNGKLEEEKKREVECKHCRDRKMHNWHYYCYTDTGKECRNRTERNDCERQDGPVPKGGFFSEPPGFGKFSTVDEDDYDPLTLMERLKYSAQNVFTGK